jgi:glycosyltransferase involved in cell wall biosynthesis
MPRVSVVIPTWDRARSFGRALDSVLAQTERDFEVIVIDDGSPGNAAQRAVLDCADPRIRYIKFPTHQGVSAARNAGVLAATGKYVAFLDDDDEWLPEKLRYQIEMIENLDDSVGAVYTARFTIDELTCRMTTTRFPDSFRPGDRNIITTSSLLIKRECLSQAGLFDEELEAAEDYDMWVRVARHFRFVYIDVPLVKYYIHPGSVSTDYGKKRRAAELLLKKYGSEFGRNRHNVARQYVALGVLWYYDGHLGEALRAFSRAVYLCPLELRIYLSAARMLFQFRTLTLALRPRGQTR